MIQQRDADQTTRLGQPPCDGMVLGAGFRVSARVIVGDHDGRGAGEDGSLEDLARMHEALRQRAMTHALCRQHGMPRIEIGHRKDLDGFVADERTKVAHHRRGIREPLSRRGFENQAAASQLEGRGKALPLRAPQARERREPAAYLPEIPERVAPCHEPPGRALSHELGQQVLVTLHAHRMSGHPQLHARESLSARSAAAAQESCIGPASRAPYASCMNVSPGREPAIRVSMMPKDTNIHGTIFGGVILSYIDQAGAVAARPYAPVRMVTVAMKEVVFKEPVLVGDMVSFYAQVTHVGHTSVTVHVDVEAERFRPYGLRVPVTAADVVYVAVDDAGNKIPAVKDGSGA